MADVSSWRVFSLGVLLVAVAGCASRDAVRILHRPDFDFYSSRGAGVVLLGCEGACNVSPAPLHDLLAPLLQSGRIRADQLHDLMPPEERRAFHQKIPPEVDLPSARAIASFRGPILAIVLDGSEPAHGGHELTIRFYVRPYRGTPGSPVMHVFHVVLFNPRVAADGELRDFVSDAVVTAVAYDGYQI
jgi:hypothetical protein